MEKANHHRMKHRYVEAPRLDKRGNPLRIKVLQAKPPIPLETFADIPDHASEQRIIRAICPRGMPINDIRQALFAEFHIEAEPSSSIDVEDQPRQQFIGRTGHRSVLIALPR